MKAKDKIIHIDIEVHKALSKEAHRRKLLFATPNQVIRTMLGMPIEKNKEQP